MRLRVVAAALLAFASSGCDRSIGPLPWQRGGLSFEQFVQTTVELRQAAAAAATPVAYQTRKQAIEKRLKVSDADLERYVQDHAEDIRLMSAVWDSVEARLGRAGKADAATRPTPQPPPPGASGPPPGRVPPPGTRVPPVPEKKPFY